MKKHNRRAPFTPLHWASLPLLALLASVVALLILAPEASAEEKFLSGFAQVYPAAAATALNSCLLCHTDPTNPGEENLNNYGKDWESGDIGDKNFLAPALVNRDSDGDGIANGAEIAQLSLPGDPASSTPPTTTTTVPGSLPNGQAIYAARCASCHGPDGGNLKSTALTRTAFISVTLNGKAPGMPAQTGLSSAEAGAVWDFLTGAVPVTTTTTKPGATTTTTRPASGASIWSSNCAGCHGANGGNVVPTRLSKTQLVSVITNGRGSMRGFSELGATQIANVASYLLSLSAVTTTSSGSTVSSAALDANPGSALFMQSCSACHGLHGEGGPGGALIGTEASRSEILAVIASGAEGMPGFGTQLTPEEIEAIADHVLGLGTDQVDGETVPETVELDDEPEVVIEYVVVTVPAPELPGEGFPVLVVVVAFAAGVATTGGLVLWTRFGRSLGRS